MGYIIHTLVWFHTQVASTLDAPGCGARWTPEVERSVPLSGLYHNYYTYTVTTTHATIGGLFLPRRRRPKRLPSGRPSPFCTY